MTLWFLARAAGLVALLAASVTVALGAAGSGARRDGRIVAQLVHRSAAVLTLALLALHAALLVADRFVDVSPSGALVPFTAGYRGTALGLGTLAAYGLIVIAATGAARGRLAAGESTARAWRPVHATAYAVWLLAVVHGLLAGTDTVRGWTLATYGLCAALVLAGVTSRLAHGGEAPHAPVRRGHRAVLRVPERASR